jgi:hypothetical protein
MNEFLAFDIIKPANPGTIDEKVSNLPNFPNYQKLEEAILDTNKKGMDLLKNGITSYIPTNPTGNYNEAIENLKRAETILASEYKNDPNETIYKLIGLTLNNLGCFYKRY